MKFRGVLGVVLLLFGAAGGRSFWLVVLVGFHGNFGADLSVIWWLFGVKNGAENRVIWRLLWRWFCGCFGADLGWHFGGDWGLV